MSMLAFKEPELKSLDLRAEYQAKLRELCPEAFSEDKIDVDVLRDLIGETVADGEEKYGLNWHGKRRARQLALEPSTGTLRPAGGDGVAEDTTQNVVIEGDNLEVLKLLQKSYSGQVKLIYIDPPYNTGKDFVYPDNFRDSIKNYQEITRQVDGEARITSNPETSGRFHTNWLNMMYPQLKLARNLLREDGLICISCDDVELTSARGMLAEIFGIENFIVQIIWKKRSTPPNDKIIGTNNDEIFFGEDGQGRPKLKRFLAEVKDGVTYPSIWDFVPLNTSGSNEMGSLFGNSVTFESPKPTGLLEELCKLGTASDSLILDFFAGSGTTGHAVMAQNAADGGNRRYILVQLPEPLDPETKEQKAAANFCDSLGNPRNIAELTKERLRRAGKKVTADNPSFAGDVGFRVFRLDSSNLKAWDTRTTDVLESLYEAVDHVKPDRTADDLLAELMLKRGLDLCARVEQRVIARKTVSAVGGGELIACFAKTITADDAELLAFGIEAWHKELGSAKETAVVFRDSAFADDVAKSNLAALLEQRGFKNVRSL